MSEAVAFTVEEVGKGGCGIELRSGAGGSCSKDSADAHWDMLRPDERPTVHGVFFIWSGWFFLRNRRKRIGFILRTETCPYSTIWVPNLYERLIVKVEGDSSKIWDFVRKNLFDSKESLYTECYVDKNFAEKVNPG